MDTEPVVHGWDMAQATGQPYQGPPELLDAAHSFLVQFARPDLPAEPGAGRCGLAHWVNGKSG